MWPAKVSTAQQACILLGYGILGEKELWKRQTW